MSVGGGSGGSGAVRNGRRRLRRGSCRARGTGNVLRILVVLHIAGILQPTAGVVVVVVGDGMWRAVGSSSVMDVTVELPSGASAEDIDAPDDDAYESITCSPVVALCRAQHQA